MAHRPIDSGGSVSQQETDISPSAIQATAEGWRKALRGSFVLNVVGIVGLLASLPISALSIPRFMLVAWISISLALIGASVIRAIETIIRLVAARGMGFGLGAGVTLLYLFIANLFFSGLGFVLAMFASGNFARGRQLRRRGKLLLPPIEERDGWHAIELKSDASLGLRSRLAQQWRENGQTEHASVAAFARLSLDLVALGAPPQLLADASRDALDEIRHAELCFSLARALDGRAESPGPFPQPARATSLSRFRTVALAQLAVSSVIDGALHEGISARVIAKLARRCVDVDVQAMLRQLTADEGRHSAHGWDVVEWCLAEGGASTAHALRGAMRAMPEQIDYSLAPEARDGSWERYGIPGAALEAEEHAKALADLRRRVDRLLADRVALAA